MSADGEGRPIVGLIRVRLGTKRKVRNTMEESKIQLTAVQLLRRKKGTRVLPSRWIGASGITRPDGRMEWHFEGWCRGTGFDSKGRPNKALVFTGRTADRVFVHQSSNVLFEVVG